MVNSICSLPVQMNHALSASALPNHRQDHFDRILIAQAQLEGLAIITADPQIARYPVKVIW